MLQFVNQAVGVLAAMAMAIVGTLIILKILDAVMGLRVSQQEESRGWTSASMAKKDTSSCRRWSGRSPIISTLRYAGK